MKITPRNILKHELIGLKVEIVESKNRYLKGLNGEIIWETSKMIIIRKNGEIKHIPKNICNFLFYLPDGKKVIVDGNLLVGKPEKRIKKVIKSW